MQGTTSRIPTETPGGGCLRSRAGRVLFSAMEADAVRLAGCLPLPRTTPAFSFAPHGVGCQGGEGVPLGTRTSPATIAPLCTRERCVREWERE